MNRREPQNWIRELISAATDAYQESAGDPETAIRSIPSIISACRNLLITVERLQADVDGLRQAEGERTALEAMQAAQLAEAQAAAHAAHADE